MSAYIIVSPFAIYLLWIFCYYLPTRFRNTSIRTIAEEVHRKRGLDVAYKRRGERVVEEDHAAEEVVEEVVEESYLAKEDDEFNKSYVVSSGLPEADAQALVRALRKHDKQILKYILI